MKYLHLVRVFFVLVGVYLCLVRVVNQCGTIARARTIFPNLNSLCIGLKFVEFQVTAFTIQYTIRFFCHFQLEIIPGHLGISESHVNPWIPRIGATIRVGPKKKCRRCDCTEQPSRGVAGQKSAWVHSGWAKDKMMNVKH